MFMDEHLIFLLQSYYDRLDDYYGMPSKSYMEWESIDVSFDVDAIEDETNVRFASVYLYETRIAEYIWLKQEEFRVAFEDDFLDDLWPISTSCGYDIEEYIEIHHSLLTVITGLGGGFNRFELDIRAKRKMLRGLLTEYAELSDLYMNKIDRYFHRSN